MAHFLPFSIFTEFSFALPFFFFVTAWIQFKKKE